MNPTTRARVAAAAAAIGLALTGVTAGPAPADATGSLPAVTPIMGAVPTGPAGVGAVSAEVLRAYGYQEREFFVSGTARAYRFDRPPGRDGRWQVSVDPGSAARYRTRIVVFTPTDGRRFSGTVISEWNNVSGGNDVMPDLIWTHNTAFRHGDAYVGVSAQFVGAEAARRNDPGRYASIAHPGDSWSYDIYSQVGWALRADAGGLLGDRPRTVIADGESQSAGRLASYVDGVAPSARSYDGYLVHSRGGSMFALQQAPGRATVSTAAGPVTVPDGNLGRRAQDAPTYTGSRTDLTVPVMYLMSETDVYASPYGALDYAPATQADSRWFRLWEIAGAAHVDDYVVRRGPTDTGSAAEASAAFDAMLQPSRVTLGGSRCGQPVNTGEQGYVLSAALQQLVRWVRTGRPASSPALFAGQAPGQGAGSAPQRDAAGNIIGGVRTPAVDVPVAALTGAVNPPDFACLLSGTTAPLSGSELAARYPTHRSFVRAWTAAVLRLTCEGYLTVPDAWNLVAAARRSTIG